MLIATLLFVIAALLAWLIAAHLAHRRSIARLRSELVSALDEYEDSIASELSTHTVPQRIMEHLRTTLANQSEQFVAFDTRFTYDPKDARFLGSPIDLVVFNGRSNGTVREVVFVEVKQHARVPLTKPERTLKEAIENGRVTWERFDLSEGSGITRDAVRELGAQDLEADVTNAVRASTRTARRALVERLTKLL